MNVVGNGIANREGRISQHTEVEENHVLVDDQWWGGSDGGREVCVLPCGGATRGDMGD